MAQIPDSIRKFVSGYSRKMETNFAIIIPAAIQYIFLLYYYNTDYFDKAYDCYTISDNKLEAACTKMKNGFEGWIFCKN